MSERPATERAASGPPAVRASVRADGAEIARLFTALGHPAAAGDVAARWDAWAAAGGTALVADRGDGTLAGVLTLSRMVVLHRPYTVGRLTALVVDAPDRGRGVGRTLVAAGEAELARMGCGLLEVTSNLRRAGAHAFYERLGYERTSARFAKVPAPAG